MEKEQNQINDNSENTSDIENQTKSDSDKKLENKILSLLIQKGVKKIHGI